MLLGFRDKMPAEHSVLLARLIDLGARCINYSARLGFYTYMNLLLLQRGSLLGMILSTVPSVPDVFLRNTRLPSDSSLLSMDLARTTLEKRRTAAQDTLLQQAILLKRIPRVPLQANVSKGFVAGTSGLPPGAGVTPVAPRGKQNPPSSSSHSRRKKKKSKKSMTFPFPVTPGSSSSLELKEKDKE